MRRGKTHHAEEWAVRRVNDVVADELRWVFRPERLPDYGVDAQAEVVADDDLVTGRNIGLQIKGGDSYFGRPKGSEGWIFRDSNDHLAYWLGHSLPIIVVMVNDNREAYWQVITPKTVTERKKTFTILVPRGQKFDATARESLLALAGRRDGLLESLPVSYAVLPPAAARPMRRAEDADLLATARLADRLAAGRDFPGMTAASVIAAEPSWLTRSRAAQDLWLAVATYADQHGEPRQSSAAFALAAQSSGPNAARAWANAGLAALSGDRDAARGHLQRARDQGQVFLADIGFAILAVPETGAAPPDVPESVSSASAGELDTEPYALRFLAEAAARSGDLNRAVRLAERAVASTSNEDSTARLALARLVHRRALATDMSSSDLRRALGYAQAAVEERRRWDGPSTEALAFLLDIHIPRNMRAAVAAALPASEGGAARNAEAESPEIARRGAFAALATGDTTAYQFFMQKLPDGPYRRELLALENDTTDQPPPQRIAAWNALLEDSADDQMTGRCIAALAKLGQWPPQADELRERSLLPPDAYDIVKAIYLARSGQLDIGLARLRQMAARSVLAAGELVQLLELDIGADAAIEEAERQVRKWANPELTLLLLDLLGHYEHFERAEPLIERSIPDDSLPAHVRLKLCNWLVARKGRERKYAVAAALARRGLEIEEDPDLAWSLVKSLFNDGNVPGAREALARHRPEPVRDDERRLWMELHLSEPVTPDDARTMADIAQREPDSPFRDGVIAVLIREVLFTAPPPGTSFPPDLTEAVRLMAEQAQHRPGGGIPLASDDDESLRQALEAGQPDPAGFPKLIDEVRRGLATLGDIARYAHRPYATVLLHRPAGILPAIDLAPKIRLAGQKAAGQALRTHTCVADLSSLHLLGLLTEDDQIRLRAALSEMIITRATVRDAVLTRDYMRGVTIATYIAALRPDGSIERTSLTSAQLSALREQADALEAITASLPLRSSAEQMTSAPEETIALAKEAQVPLWCDDMAMRQTARAAGIPAFSLLDLVTTLSEEGKSLDQSAMFRRLAGQYVVDLPLTGDDIVTVARNHKWEPGPAHTAIARPDWWLHHDEDWESTWLYIAEHARRHSAAALLHISKAALTGSLTHVPGSFRTQRYQQLVVLALIACHNITEPPPPDLLSDLADYTGSQVAPSPHYVLGALTQELQRMSTKNAASVALALLPEGIAF
jgi:hypothetical protein